MDFEPTANVDLDRRSLLKTAGVAGALGPMMMGMSFGSAQAQEEEIISSDDLPVHFGDIKGSPGVVDFTPPFNLKDPLENWYATLKISNNLIGAKTDYGWKSHDQNRLADFQRVESVGILTVL